MQLFSTVSVQHAPRLVQGDGGPAAQGERLPRPGRGRPDMAGAPGEAGWARGGCFLHPGPRVCLCLLPPGLAPGSSSCSGSACVSAGAAPQSLLPNRSLAASVTDAPVSRSPQRVSGRRSGPGPAQARLVLLELGGHRPLPMAWPALTRSKQRRPQTPCLSRATSTRLCSSPRDPEPVETWRRWCCRWYSAPAVQGWAGVSPRPASQPALPQSGVPQTHCAPRPQDNEEGACWTRVAQGAGPGLSAQTSRPW